MKLVLDMNLSPDWVPFLTTSGWHTVHWTTIGDPRADDRTIMNWAREHGAVVFTHDLDFGTLLALTNASGPSVVQIRTQDISPGAAGNLVLSSLKRFESELTAGALIVIDEVNTRARILPLRPNA